MGGWIISSQILHMTNALVSWYMHWPSAIGLDIIALLLYIIILIKGSSSVSPKKLFWQVASLNSSKHNNNMLILQHYMAHFQNIHLCSACPFCPLVESRSPRQTAHVFQDTRCVKTPLPAVTIWEGQWNGAGQGSGPRDAGVPSQGFSHCSSA